MSPSRALLGLPLAPQERPVRRMGSMLRGLPVRPLQVPRAPRGRLVRLQVWSYRLSSFVVGKFKLLMNRLNEVALCAVRRVLL